MSSAAKSEEKRMFSQATWSEVDQNFWKFVRTVYVNGYFSGLHTISSGFLGRTIRRQFHCFWYTSSQICTPCEKTPFGDSSNYVPFWCAVLFIQNWPLLTGTAHINCCWRNICVYKEWQTQKWSRETIFSSFNDDDENIGTHRTKAGLHYIATRA